MCAGTVPLSEPQVDIGWAPTHRTDRFLIPIGITEMADRNIGTSAIKMIDGPTGVEEVVSPVRRFPDQTRSTYRGAHGNQQLQLMMAHKPFSRTSEKCSIGRSGAPRSSLTAALSQKTELLARDTDGSRVE